MSLLVDLSISNPNKVETLWNVTSFSKNSFSSNTN